MFTLGCEADNQVATTPIMSKIEAVWRIFWFFGCIVVFFLSFFLAKRNFQRLYSTHYSRTATTWLTLPFRPCALLSESPSFVPVPICGAEQQQLEKNVCNICVMRHYLARLASHRRSSFFWNSPGKSTHGVLYTQKSAFSRRTIVRSGHFGARPLKKSRWCWSSPKLAINQHGRARKCLECTFVLLEKPQMSVYNTSWVDIPGEIKKIAQVATG